VNNLPTEINFGWAKFEVQYLKGPIYTKNDETEQVFGDVCFDEYIVRVDISQSEACIQETLIHELVHIILEMSCLGAETYGEMDNESKTTLISRNIMLLLRLNSTPLLELFDGNKLKKHKEEQKGS
tara:strand:+ start:46 stop:423 length:378 start_codon:yes stop_codon:yes gene_type:complete